MEAQAKYEFNASGEDELSFRKGDVLKILSAEDEWYRAELHGHEGYVPKNYISLKTPSWFHENISRRDAEEILMSRVLGSFVIRDSQSSPGDFSISVRHEEDVQHFKVMKDLKGHYFLWTEKFTSLNKLVDYYKKCSISKQKSIFLQDGSQQETVNSHNNQEKRGSLDRQKVEMPRPGGAAGDAFPTPMFRRPAEQEKRVSLERPPIELPRPGGPFREANSIPPYRRPMDPPLQQEKRGSLEKTPTELPRAGGAAGDSNTPPYRKPVEPPMQQKVMKVQAMYDFIPEEDDELGFKCNDIIEVLDSSDPSWWKGRFRGQVGLFPVNYVIPINR